MESRYTLLQNLLFPDGKRKDLLYRINLIEPHTHTFAPSALDGPQSEILEIAPHIRVGSVDRAHLDKLDATLLLCTPPLFDLHTHCYEPGYPYRETLDSGMSAAAAGGFGTVLCMPDTRPCVDSAELVQFLSEKSRARKDCTLLPCASLTRGGVGGIADGVTPCDYASLLQAGAVAFSDHDAPPKDNALLLSMTKALAAHDALYLCTPADPAFPKGEAREGMAAKRLRLAPQDPQREVFGVMRAIAAARAGGCRIHLQSISCAQSLPWIRAAKQAHLPITAETAPPYFLLSDADLLYTGAAAKLSPPLQSAQDRQQILEAVCDGTLDCISSDHTPCEAREKENVRTAAFGTTALETVFALCYTHLVRPGLLSLSELCQRLCQTPASLLQKTPSPIAVGAPAYFSLFSCEAELLDKRHFYGKTATSPFLGLSLHGLIAYACRDGLLIPYGIHQKQKRARFSQ